MTYFYDDTDLTGSGEFVEGTVSLGGRFTPDVDGTFVAVRSRFPALAGSTPLARIYNASGTQLFAGAFATTTADAWNSSVACSVHVTAGTPVDLVQVVTRYVAKGGFLSGGSVTRGHLTLSQSRFDSGDVAPTSTSTATYYVDGDFVPDAGGTPVSILDLVTGYRWRSADGSGVATSLVVPDGPGGIRWRAGADGPVVIDLKVSDTASGLRLRSGTEATTIAVSVPDNPRGWRWASTPESVAVSVVVPDAPSGWRLRGPSDPGVVLGIAVSDSPSGFRIAGALDSGVTLGGAVTAVDVPSGMRWRSAPEVGVDVAAPITLPVKFKSYTWRDVFSAMVDVNDFVASVTVDRLP